MDINKMTRKEFEALPNRQSFDSDVGEFDSLVMLPMKYKHDSGYRCMDFVACKNNEPIMRLSGCSDVIHIDGIGGYGKNWFEKEGNVPRVVMAKGWSIDCLGKSGLLRIFVTGGFKITCGLSLSSFEIWGEKEKEEKWNNLN